MTRAIASTPVSVRLHPENARFVQSAARSGQSASSIINKALERERKYKLYQAIHAGFASQTDQDAREAEEGMLNYWNIVKNG